ncbi:MAG: hypothetical protein KatS3mg019_1290 [Fimbriimonadales bacterium]|nr:MAG: hypothetical protein KatS3mg019_1290 [Fimbriimonadales bacterium]
MRTQHFLGTFWMGCLGGLFFLSIVACGGGGGGGSAPPPNTGADTTPPTIGAIEISPSVLYPNASLELSVTATDTESGVASVVVVITYPDNSQRIVALSLQQGQYRATFTPQWNGTGGSARLQVRAVDRASNQATKETTINALGNPPEPPF